VFKTGGFRRAAGGGGGDFCRDLANGVRIGDGFDRVFQKKKVVGGATKNPPREKEVPRGTTIHGKKNKKKKDTGDGGPRPKHGTLALQSGRGKRWKKRAKGTTNMCVRYKTS